MFVRVRGKLVSMKRRISFILIALAAVGLLAAIISQKPAQPQTAAHQATAGKKIDVVYCPTMQPVVDKLDLTEKIEFNLVGSSHEALQLLKLNKVDEVIIGRKARAEEIENETNEFQANPSAVTLAADRYQMVTADDLTSQVIVTSLPLETASEKFPDLKFVSANEAESSEAEAADNTSGLELVLWKDLDYSSQDLAVILDESGQKVPSFRTPFVYYRQNKQNSIQILVNNLKNLGENKFAN